MHACTEPKGKQALTHRNLSTVRITYAIVTLALSESKVTLSQLSGNLFAQQYN